MIFAEIECDEYYGDLYVELCDYLASKFSDIQSGLQGDAWIWVKGESENVAVDTFSSMRFQIKCPSKSNPLTASVINALKEKYPVKIYAAPIVEGHEEI